AQQLVDAVVAGDLVGEGVAGAVDGEGAGQYQVFERSREREADGAVDRIDAAIGAGQRVRHDVAGVVDEVNIVALAAVHVVGADAAIHGVVAVAAVERIAERAAGQTTGQRVIAATADQSVGILAAV